MNIDSHLPILGFAAYSGTGKTTLLVNIIPLLKQQGIAVGVIKHAHHAFEIDQPGKDSYRLRKAGANQMLIGSDQRWALMTECVASNTVQRLQEYIKHLDHDNLDLILVEGFRFEAIAKIELHRPALGHPLICQSDQSVIAIASDGVITESLDLPILDLNNVPLIVNYIIELFNLKN